MIVKYRRPVLDISITITSNYLTTNNKGDKLMMAKPCQNCLNTIDFTLKKKNYKLKKIIYTDDAGKFVYI